MSTLKQENVYLEMAGRMSACGKLGKHKYADASTQDWTSRTMYICEDIEPKANIERKETIAKVKLLEQKAINK